MNFKQIRLDAITKINEELSLDLLTSLEYTAKEFAINKTYRDSMSKARKRIIYNN